LELEDLGGYVSPAFFAIWGGDPESRATGALKSRGGCGSGSHGLRGIKHDCPGDSIGLAFARIVRCADLQLGLNFAGNHRSLL
jgi:hypothetical protein